jgi:uncharacterized membrane protein
MAMEIFNNYIAGILSVSANDVGLSFSTQTIPQAFAAVVSIIATLIGSLSVVMMIVGGLLYTVSAGDPGKIKRAKDTITYSITGVVISIIAFAIVTFVAKTFK